ncbi:MAG TPA: universal stress protein [Methylomirabilota bacterium]|nr:universal stress protein [Methylomirabilota bacterium]
MAKRILVPLDQSAVAEFIVPIVADTARGAGATVRLLHVAPEPENRIDEHGRVIAYTDQEMARLEAEGLDYLRTVEARLDGAQVECAVRFGDPVTEILEEAGVWGADLIAVCTAGRSAASRIALGSVAEQVFRKAEPPVLLLRPDRWSLA